MDESKTEFPLNPIQPPFPIKWLIIIIILLLLVPLLVATLRISTVKDKATTLGARVDWQAVISNKQPIYYLEYRVIQVKNTDRHEFMKKIEERKINVDNWESPDLIMGATDPQIKQLRKDGYTVEVLYNSYDEYQKVMEKKFSEK